VALRIHLPGLDLLTARRLANAAHAECPYARMGRGNIEVRLLLAAAGETADREI
jgi:organic hydroperoxide reductase OsmC/OhrA